MESKKAIQLFNDLLELKRELVGVTFLATKEDYEAFDAPRCQRLLPYCVTVRNASEGKGTKMTIDNFACPASAVAMGLMKEDDYSQSGQKHANMKVYEDICVSRSVASEMVYCQQENYGVAVVPASSWQENPDVVILVTDPYNAMRVLQGHAYHSGQLSTIKMTGMQAMCQECTSFPFERDQINFSMMCSGTRYVAQWGRDELSIGIPYHQLGEVADGLLKTLNPMENAKYKKTIMARLKEAGREEDYDIRLKENYYRGAYQGIKSRTPTGESE